MTTLDVSGYLARLGVSAPAAPSIEALRVLHRAQVERIPYEAIEIQLGRPTTIDPYDSAVRIVDRHRGGYCYHLNGAFSLLLRELGYDVVWHRAGVQNRAAATPPGPDWANHLALTVHGLPSPENPAGDWLVDAGLGDGLHEPLPLVAGTYTQGPFSYRLRRRTSRRTRGGSTTITGARSSAWTSGPRRRRAPTSPSGTRGCRRHRSRDSCGRSSCSGGTRRGTTSYAG